MKITIEIECENVAFDGRPEDEIYRILQEYINRDVDMVDIDVIVLKDINGNSVGRVICYD